MGPVLSTFIFLALFAASTILGRKVKLPPFTITLVSLTLIFTISLWAGSEVPISSTPSLLLLSLVFSSIIVIISYIMGLPFLKEELAKSKLGHSDLKYFVPLVLGFLIGWLSRVDVDEIIIQLELYALAIVVGLDSGKYVKKEIFKSLSLLPFLSIMVNFLGDLVSALVFSLLFSLPFNLSLAIALGSGWYSYTGPIVAVHFGPYYGVLAFLVNFLREQLTFLLVPFLLKLRPSPVGAIAVGGATSMDVTLPFYVESLGPKYAVSSVVSGVIITFLVPIVVPLAISL